MVSDVIVPKKPRKSYKEPAEDEFDEEDDEEEQEPDRANGVGAGGDADGNDDDDDELDEDEFVVEKIFSHYIADDVRPTQAPAGRHFSSCSVLMSCTGITSL